MFNRSRIVHTHKTAISAPVSATLAKGQILTGPQNGLDEYASLAFRAELRLHFDGSKPHVSRETRSCARILSLSSPFPNLHRGAIARKAFAGRLKEWDVMADVKSNVRQNPSTYFTSLLLFSTSSIYGIPFQLIKVGHYTEPLRAPRYALDPAMTLLLSTAYTDLFRQRP